MPQIEIDATTARRLIGDQWPQLAGSLVQLIGSGWDNTVFKIGEELVFRFPRREIAVPLLEMEAKLLPWLVPQLPREIPLPVYFGRATAEFPWPFLGYRRVAGETACQLALTPEQRGQMAGPIGHFLRALHALDPSPALARGLRPDPFKRFDVAMRNEKAMERLEKLQDRAGLSGVAKLKRHLSAALVVPLANQLVVVHGDVYVRHLMIKDGLLAGVIDWGDMHLGQSATDLALVHSFLPPEAHSRFFDAYGAIDEATWILSRFRAIGHLAAVTEYAREIGDAALLREGLLGLGWVASV